MLYLIFLFSVFTLFLFSNCSSERILNSHNTLKSEYLLNLYRIPDSTYCPGKVYDYPSGGVILMDDSLSSKIIVTKISNSICAIFPAEYDVKFNYRNAKKRFTPTIELLYEIEDNIKKQFWEANVRFIRDQVWFREKEIYGQDNNRTEIDRLESFINFIVFVNWEDSSYNRLDRQYLGIVNQKDERILVIKFIDFCSDPYNLKSYLTKSWITGWHGWFESNVSYLEYNIDTNRLNALGHSHL